MLGSDYVGKEGENAHPMLSFDGNWVHIKRDPCLL